MGRIAEALGSAASRIHLPTTYEGQGCLIRIVAIVGLGWAGLSALTMQTEQGNSSGTATAIPPAVFFDPTLGAGGGVAPTEGPAAATSGGNGGYRVVPNPLGGNSECRVIPPGGNVYRATRQLGDPERYSDVSRVMVIDPGGQMLGEFTTDAMPPEWAGLVLPGTTVCAGN